MMAHIDRQQQASFRLAYWLSNLGPVTRFILDFSVPRSALADFIELYPCSTRDPYRWNP